VLNYLNCEVGGSNLQRNRQLYPCHNAMISEETLIFSSFVENRVQYYRNVSKLIILKGTSSACNLRVLVKQCVCVTKLSTKVWYLQRYWSQSCSYILEYSGRFPSVFATNFSCPFHTTFKPPLGTDFSRYFLCIVFDRSLDITVVFQNQTIHLFVWRVTY
jgi:hypothetical protein